MFNLEEARDSFLGFDWVIDEMSAMITIIRQSSAGSQNTIDWSRAKQQNEEIYQKSRKKFVKLKQVKTTTKEKYLETLETRLCQKFGLFFNSGKKIRESTIGQTSSQLCLKKSGKMSKINKLESNPQKSTASPIVSSFTSTEPIYGWPG